MNLPVYKLVIDDSDELGVDFVALVDKPAIEKNWMAFDEVKQYSFVADKDRRLISGALMAADLPIYRRDESGEYYVIFDKEQIEKIAQRYFKSGFIHNVNMMHDAERKVTGVYMVESMIIDKSRGIRTPEGYPTLTEGSWFGTFKVDNDEVWNDFIKTGVFKGFSVEGAFAHRKLTDMPQEQIEGVAQRIQSLKKKIKEFATTKS
jgi:hypothetical protein